ncbi:unnamed protein product [Sphagnum troendelagicum]
MRRSTGRMCATFKSFETIVTSRAHVAACSMTTQKLNLVSWQLKHKETRLKVTTVTTTSTSTTSTTSTSTITTTMSTPVEAPKVEQLNKLKPKEVAAYVTKFKQLNAHEKFLFEKKKSEKAIALSSNLAIASNKDENITCTRNVIMKVPIKKPKEDDDSDNDDEEHRSKKSPGYTQVPCLMTTAVSMFSEEPGIQQLTKMKIQFIKSKSKKSAPIVKYTIQGTQNSSKGGVMFTMFTKLDEVMSEKTFGKYISDGKWKDGALEKIRETYFSKEKLSGTQKYQERSIDSVPQHHLLPMEKKNFNRFSYRDMEIMQLSGFGNLEPIKSFNGNQPVETNVYGLTNVYDLNTSSVDSDGKRKLRKTGITVTVTEDGNLQTPTEYEIFGFPVLRWSSLKLSPTTEEEAATVKKDLELLEKNDKAYREHVAKEEAMKKKDSTYTPKRFNGSKERDYKVENRLLGRYQNVVEMVEFYAVSEPKANYNAKSNSTQVVTVEIIDDDM